MTHATQSEAHSAAEQTRELWRKYLSASTEIIAGSNWPDLEANTGRVVRLLREQKRILGLLLGEVEKSSQ